MDVSKFNLFGVLFNFKDKKARDDHAALAETVGEHGTEIDGLKVPTFSEPAANANVREAVAKVKSGTAIGTLFTNVKAALNGLITLGEMRNYLVNNGTVTETGKYFLDAAYGKTLLDKFNQLNSNLAWAGLTFTPSSTYVTDNYTYAYRMGNVCLCALSFAAKVKLNAWVKVVVGTVSLPSKMACFCIGYAQNAAKSVVFSVGNIVESSSEGRNIYLETLNQTIEAGDWLRGFLIYFYRN